jgi:CRP/FNR family cyclic AMP-dependent transcriptional regulator
MNDTLHSPAHETAPPSVADLLARHELFRGLSREHLDLLARVAMPVEFKAGELIFREGDPANRFYVILDGEVRVESPVRDEEPVLLQRIGAGDVLGWSWLFPPYYWHFDARAERPTRAIFFYGTWLRENCEQDPAFGYQIMKRITGVVIQRLQATRRELIQKESRAAKPSEVRLAGN